MTSLLGGVFGVVKNKIKKIWAVESGGAVTPPQNNNIENYGFYAIIKGAGMSAEDSPLNNHKIQ